MTSLKGAVKTLWDGEEGLTVVEYAIAGGLIGGVVSRAMRGRRGRYTWLVVAVCVVLGAFVAWTTRPGALLTIGIYVFMATGAAIGALRLERRR